MVEGEITEKVPFHLIRGFYFLLHGTLILKQLPVQAGYEPAGYLSLSSQSKIKQTKTEKEKKKKIENCPIYPHQTCSI